MGKRYARYRRASGLAGALGLAILLVFPAAAADTPLYKDSSQPLERRVADLLERLTLEEKVALLAGGGNFSTTAIPRLGIPALDFADGPNGLRSNNSEPTTAFPTGVTMASTWNPELIAALGAAIGREAKAKGVELLLGPNVNIQRTPLAGRNFESYSEDPVLAGHIGTGFVQGVQSTGVGATVKHYTANNQEHGRRRISAEVSERALREIYFPAFETIVRKADPWAAMAAYNRINGHYGTANRFLLKEVLKGEWRFDGIIMSDWGGVHSTAKPIKAGLDLEMPGPPVHFGERLVQAARDWQVPMRDIDDSARRMLRLILRTGVMDGKDAAEGELNSERHRTIAQQVAEEGIVLLKNGGDLLPLDKEEIETLAVIGPNADKAVIQGGGSAQVVPHRSITPLEGIRTLVGNDVRIIHARGVDNEPFAPTADARLLSPTEKREDTGLRARYFASSDLSGPPGRDFVDTHFFKFGFGAEVADEAAAFSARWAGYFHPPADGRYEFTVVDGGGSTLMIGGETIIAAESATRPSPVLEFLPVQLRRAVIELEAGRAYPIQLDYRGDTGNVRVMRLGMRTPTGTIEEAVRAARQADAALVFAGAATTSESEGADRETMQIHGRQNELIGAVLAANPDTAVVLNNGAPLAMPWIDKAPAVVEAWLPGQEGGHAIANILFGAVNPSGKLPVTFPERIEDNPTHIHYPGGRSVFYGEDVFVGYRYYDTKKIEPLFPFGHGLSYTEFAYDDLDARVDGDDETVTVRVTIRNTGDRAGKDALQLYVRDIESAAPRPIKALKAFKKVGLSPGDGETVTFALGPRAFSFYDEMRGRWVCESGEFEILVGRSSRDIRARTRLRLEAGCADLETNS